MGWGRGVFGPAVLFAATWLFAGQAAHATVVDVFEASGYLNWGENPGSQTLYELGSGASYLSGRASEHDFVGAGFDSTFTSMLVDGIGGVSWAVTNNTGAAVSDVEFFAFMNLDILDPVSFSPFNEDASFQGTGLPAGAPTDAAGFTSWEADDGDDFYGDLRDNLDSGALDNANQVVPFLTDVAFALGFEVGALGAGETFEVSLFITEGVLPEGLIQSDLDSAELVSFNGYATKGGGPVLIPEPETFWIMLLGLIFIGLATRRGLCRQRI